MKDNVYMLNAEEARVALAAFNRLERLGREEMEQDARRAGEDPVPERMLKKYRAILKRGRRKAYWKSTKGRVVRAAIAVLVIGSLMVPYFTVDAYRVNVQNFFYSISDGITEFVSRGGGRVEPKDGVYLPEYLPDGFNRENYDPNYNEISMKYVRGEEWIIFVQSTVENGKVHTEGDANDENVISINGCLATVVETPWSSVKLIWHNSTTVFRIESNLNLEEVIKIAENIK